MSIQLLAHAIGGVKDLPIPGQFFLYGGGAVLGLSFIALGVLWSEPHLEDADRGRGLRPLLQRIVLSHALRVVFGAIGTALFVLVVAAGWFGSQDPDGNIAPTTVWVIFWLGLVWVSLLVGNVWAILSPLRAIADLVAWLARPLRWRTRPYPERLGWWPAAALFFAVAAMELVSSHPSDPRNVATAASLYAVITWAGMAVFGRRAWLENGEAFNVYFGLFARMSPFEIRREGDDRRVVVRPPFVGLAKWRPGPGAIAMVAAMLGTVGFDSITRTSSWRSFRADSLTAESTRVPVELGLMAACVCFVACAYLAAIWFAKRFTDGDVRLWPRFLASLVPIALVYSIAHYVSLLLGFSQLVVPLASDPFGHGWNLFGSAGWQPNLKPLSSHQVWYIQTATLVGGHVVGLLLAHDRSVKLFRGGDVLRSQYVMLTLMVIYTVGGLYLLSQP